MRKITRCKFIHHPDQSLLPCILVIRSSTCCDAVLLPTYQRRLLVHLPLSTAILHPLPILLPLLLIPQTRIREARLHIWYSRQIKRQPQPRHHDIDRTKRLDTPSPLERLMAQVAAICQVQDGLLLVLQALQVSTEVGEPSGKVEGAVVV